MEDRVLTIIIVLFTIFAMFILTILTIRKEACNNCPHKKICEDLEKQNQPNICEQSDNMINKCQDMNYLVD